MGLDHMIDYVMTKIMVMKLLATFATRVVSCSALLFFSRNFAVAP